MIFSLLDSDFRILDFLVRFRAARAAVLADVAGYRTTKYCTERLRVLTQKGYLTRARVAYGDKYVYAATGKAHAVLGVVTRPYALTNQNALHEANIAVIALYFVHKYNLPLDGILTERDQRQGVDKRDAKTHYPDLYIASMDIAIEYERVAKTTERLRQKVQANNAHKVQIWVVDADQRGLARRILACKPQKATKYGSASELSVIYLEDLSGAVAERTAQDGYTVAD